MKTGDDLMAMDMYSSVHSQLQCAPPLPRQFLDRIFMLQAANHMRITKTGIAQHLQRFETLQPSPEG
jgi:hypothetical protein